MNWCTMLFISSVLVLFLIQNPVTEAIPSPALGIEVQPTQDGSIDSRTNRKEFKEYTIKNVMDNVCCAYNLPCCNTKEK